jgi:hypothetical protein
VYRQLGRVVLATPSDEPAAVVLPARDGFADPPGLAVRTDVLEVVGFPPRVRAGGEADLVARLEAAGHEVRRVSGAAPARRATPASLHREGSARLWLFRRHPARFPLPRGGETGLLRYLMLALGALRANALPPGERFPGRVTV